MILAFGIFFGIMAIVGVTALVRLEKCKGCGLWILKKAHECPKCGSPKGSSPPHSQ